MKANDVIERVRQLSHDQVSPYRIGDIQLFKWIKDAQTTLITIRPDANNGLIEVTPEVGAAEQDINELIEGKAVHRVIDIIRNVTSGLPIYRTDRQLLSSYKPSWMTTEGDGDIQNWVTEKLHPSLVWLFPLPTVDTRLEILVSYEPSEVISKEDELDVKDIFMGPVVDYILARCYELDREFTLMDKHNEMFYTALGLDATVTGMTK